MLEDLYIKSQRAINNNNQNFKRYFIKNYKLEHRLSIIKGPRGVGKTTTLIQYMQENYNFKEAIYVNLDDIEINSSMIEIAKEFELMGGKLLCFDEIHKYNSWSAELKNIYDNFPNLKVIATGSSAMHINKGSHDLSRRAIIYDMVGMSFREFLNLSYGFNFKYYELEEILNHHQDLANDINLQIKSQDKTIIPLFKEYLEYGYYPYYLSMPNKELFLKTLNQNINTSLESDLLNIFPNTTGNTIKKLKTLLSIIIKSVPFVPNLIELRKIANISDDRTLKDYLAKLDEAGLIKLLMQNSLALKNLDKPEKIFMNNPNLASLGGGNIGNLRETFFVNQLDNYYLLKEGNFANKGIFASKKGDFLCEEKYTFEVGGKNKSFEQIKEIKNSFVVADNLEFGFGNKIPLWIFGFLY